ncbi:MAG TPA: family 20 glycosylhydrolase [Chitinophagaceae bacterium]|nr:family 20 glycosylhydrolase [Chitinophagaceae bacterium]
MKKTFFFILFLSSLITKSQHLSIIPEPVESILQKGNFILSPTTVIIASDEAIKPSVEFFNNYLKRYYGFTLKTAKQATSNFIYLNTKVFIRPPDKDGYSLHITDKSIDISGDTHTGTFYGIQTLIQLLPLQNEENLKIPCFIINDYPRFTYRGLHLDVSRHFFGVEYIKKYIDYIALHKMNYFHWHLTDDQGWRIEIKKYPKLTEIGAWRDGTIIGRFPGTGNDGKRYGGYYTQDQIKEIVKYAADRYITIIPEIEMPGHSMAALAAYPQLGTTPEKGYAVSQTWGINGEFNNVLNPSEFTFNFLQDVLDEVMNLFPSNYLHIGGDECDKRWWKESEFCQQLMKQNGLKDENELQSYFIQRIEKYINSKGRKIIGWDEILEGGLAPNATVMSWRGEEGGIIAARQDHDVIMTPGNPVYFDHSQSENEDSVTIGGYNPIEKVYAYEPIPKQLNAQQAKHVLGAQANMWTEYMASQSKIEYMLFPRLSALCEVLWTPKEKRNWQSFEKKLLLQFKRYDFMNINYSKAYFGLKAKVLPATNHNGVLWQLESKVKNSTINYAIENSSRSIPYKTPIKVTSAKTYIATLNYDKKNASSIIQKFSFNKATGKKISLLQKASAKYPGDGAFTLVNGVQNIKGRAKSNEFLGFEGKDCEAVIDLGKQTKINEVVAHVLEDTPSWIYRPKSIEVFVSNDGIHFKSKGKSDTFIDVYPVKKAGISFQVVQTRFVKVVIKNFGVIPAGKPGGGHNAWLFVDEIEVN